MATIDKLVPLLASVTGLQPGTVERHGLKLREAALLPAEGDDLAPAHAAALLVAVMVARAPTESVEAVQAVGTLPLRLIDNFVLQNGGRSTAVLMWAEDAPIPPGAGSMVAEIGHSLASALAFYIRDAGAADSNIPQPTGFEVVRDLERPTARIVVGLPVLPPDIGAGAENRLLYAPPGDLTASMMLPIMRMVTSVYMPGWVLAKLGELIAGAPVSRVEAPALVAVPVEPQTATQAAG